MYIMPQFLYPDASELNPLLRPKQRVLKKMKKQFKGTETTMGQQGDLTDKFNRIYDSMIKLIASLGEISNTLKLGGNTAKGTDAMSRYVSAISTINIEVARLLLFITQEVPSLQIFNTSQIQTLSGLNNQLVSVVQEIDQISSSMTPASVNRFRMILKPLINEVATLQQKLEGINTSNGRGNLTTFGMIKQNAPQALGTTSRTPARTPARTPTRTPAQTPQDADFFTPMRRNPTDEELMEEGTIPRRSGRERRPPVRYGSGRSLTHRRFL